MLIYIYITGGSVPNIIGTGIEVSRGEWVIRRWVEILTYQGITEPPLCHIPSFKAKCSGRWYLCGVLVSYYVRGMVPHDWGWWAHLYRYRHWSVPKALGEALQRS